jgi:hypothetical protein
MPTTLAQRLTDLGGSPFARAAQQLAAGDEIEELRFALVALTNRVLAADRVAPGDDEAVTVTLQRLAATIDLAIERVAPNDDERGAAALRTIPLIRLFRSGVTMVGKVRRLALAVARSGPFGRRGLALAEADDAAVLESLTRVRPLYPRLLDQPPAAGERPFQSLADLARAAAAVERAAAAQAMLRGLGVEPRHLAPDGPLLADTGADAAALDAALLARTVLVKRLLGAGDKASDVAPLDPGEVRAFESNLVHPRLGPPTLPVALAKRARELLGAAAPAELAGAVVSVADRWIGGLAAPVPKATAGAAKAATRKAKPAAFKAKPAAPKAKPAARKAKPAARKAKPAARKAKAPARKPKPRPKPARGAQPKRR